MSLGRLGWRTSWAWRWGVFILAVESAWTAFLVPDDLQCTVCSSEMDKKNRNA